MALKHRTDHGRRQRDCRKLVLAYFDLSECTSYRIESVFQDWKFGGAGGLVPITGFANSVASSAIEFQAEGQVFGIGCKIFTIAGPVILYGILSSWLLGIVYYILKLMEVVG